MSVDAAVTDRPLAVVTGASSGIGRALADDLAERGHDLVLCAEDAELAVAAEQLARRAGVVPVRTDLATSDGVEQLVAAISATGRPVAVLALNAGVGLGGAFVGSDLTAQLRVVHLDVVSTVHLAHRLLPGMVAQGAGRVLVTSSVAATMPGPWNATYAASKAFVQSFAEAVRRELAGTGVTVTALQPGPTDTEFFDRSGMDETLLGRGPRTDAATVARKGLDALFAGKDHVVVSAMGATQAGLSRVLPERARAAVHGAMAKPRGDDADDAPARGTPDAPQEGS
ncbi:MULTISPECIES: SDR family oxidoreductase [unclassified Actinotalea]|uniref:SDR family NAD(P)-dependent oxidoreductase n=1 Tax=unclassified Actinotalea TaxID=2638618 RepID=UPI002102879E|nr:MULTISPECIES: SDR family NAD(P)-dependent oxidoreductase [unclassified Actinotalea]